MSVSYQIRASSIAILSIHRPEVCNAMDWETMDAFRQKIGNTHTNPQIKVLIITGSEKAFISGGDLNVLHKATSRQDGIRLSQGMTDALNRLETLPIPVIAAINGPARGGGAEIALACDLRVVSSDATLGFVQISLGLTPGWGGGQRLLHCVGYARAFELLLTGRILDAEEMQAIGLATAIAPPSQALPRAMLLAKAIADKPPEAVRAIKSMLKTGLSTGRSTAMMLEQSIFPDLWTSMAHRKAVESFRDRKKTNKKAGE